MAEWTSEKARGCKRHLAFSEFTKYEWQTKIEKWVSGRFIFQYVKSADTFMYELSFIVSCSLFKLWWNTKDVKIVVSSNYQRTLAKEVEITFSYSESNLQMF